MIVVCHLDIVLARPGSYLPWEVLINHQIAALERTEAACWAYLYSQLSTDRRQWVPLVRVAK